MHCRLLPYNYHPFSVHTCVSSVTSLLPIRWFLWGASLSLTAVLLYLHCPELLQVICPSIFAFHLIRNQNPALTKRELFCWTAPHSRQETGRAGPVESVMFCGLLTLRCNCEDWVCKLRRAGQHDVNLLQEVSIYFRLDSVRCVEKHHKLSFLVELLHVRVNKCESLWLLVCGVLENVAELWQTAVHLAVWLKWHNTSHSWQCC